jgi:RNA polymerase sigma-70 factor, ECF subfamily
VFLETTLPYLDVVYGVARGIARDSHFADDLVQETYLRAFAAFHTHDRTRTRGWLVAILLNAARSEGRRRARRGETLVADLPDASGRHDDVGDAAMAACERDRIVAALAAIPEEQRLAVVLMDVAGLTAQEVADALGCPRGTVLARAHRGRRKLAAQLARDGTRP